MTAHGLFGMFVPSAKRPVMGLVIEWFPSRDVCAGELKTRVRSGRGRLFTDMSGKYLAPMDRKVVEYPVFDETAYFRVWLRPVVDPPELLSRPDEEWIVLESGKVERIAWADTETDPLCIVGNAAWANSRGSN
jgi:hypothetical protein